MNLFLDIESIPSQSKAVRAEIEAGISPPASYKKPETIDAWERNEKPAAVEEAWRKTALSGDRGEIVCIAWAFDNRRVESASRLLDTSESFLIRHFFGALNEAVYSEQGRPQSVTFVGHNVKDFDLRFLFQRAVIHGIRPPIHLPHDARYNGDRVFDTMTAWAGWGQRISLARLCTALGLPMKGDEIGEEIDGSMVWDFVKAGRIDEVSAYCRGDVERVRAAYKRLTFQEAA